MDRLYVTSQYGTTVPPEVLQHADVTTDTGTHLIEPLAQTQNGRYQKDTKHLEQHKR